MIARWAWCFLVVAIVAPYWDLLGFDKVIVTDDVATSDSFLGEQPVRAWIAGRLAHGQSAQWLPDLYCGLPLPWRLDDPLSLVVHGLLPVSAAQTAFVLLGLLLAGFGARAFATSLGAGPLGALLTGIAYAHSGYLASRMRHAAIFEVAVLFPWGMAAIEHALRGRVRAGALGLAAIFAWQIRSGFPQSAYYAGLGYLSWALLRGVPLRQGRTLLVLAGAGVLGLAMGAATLWPFWEFVGTTSRGEARAFAFEAAEQFNLELLWTFISPAAVGTVHDFYTGHGLYWEEYVYFGRCALLLAVFALVRRVAGVLPLSILLVVTALIGLGEATPVYGLLWHIIPGLDRFRFPTRILFIFTLAAVTLAGLGLDRAASGRSGRFAVAILLFAALDVSYFQPAQNRWGNARAWLAAPPTVAAMGPGRVYTLSPYFWHQQANATGTVEALHANRGFLQPNSTLYWGLPHASGYSGATPRWSARFWGAVDEQGLVAEQVRSEAAAVTVEPALWRLLALGHVRWVVSGWRLDAPFLREAYVGAPYVYELLDTLPRAWVVPSWREVATAQEAEQALTTMDARALAIVGPEALGDPPVAGVSGSAVITADGGDAIELTASGPGLLIVADTWYPGWTALVDGIPTPIVRANLWQRGVELTGGAHTIAMAFTLPRSREGAWISGVAGALWLLGLGTLLRRSLVRPSPLPPAAPIPSETR